jgi:hypothetical protein
VAEEGTLAGVLVAVAVTSSVPPFGKHISMFRTRRILGDS